MPTMQETHASGGHRKLPRQKCAGCKAERSAQTLAYSYSQMPSALLRAAWAAKVHGGWTQTDHGIACRREMEKREFALA